MNQSDGQTKLKRIEFVFQGKSYKFILNPEEYHQSEPNRATVTQTKAGAWIDEFGAGIAMISFKGTTGLKKGGSPKSGFLKFKELRDTIRSVYDRVKPGQVVPSSKELLFYNYTDGEYWVVTPLTFDLRRSVARPLLYAYEITLICQRRISQPNPNDVSSTSSITSDRRLR